MLDQTISLATPPAAPTRRGENGPATDRTGVAIVGAGPYGLSLAAHLRARGVPFRIIGRPMQTWLHNMPADMHLKSEPFACDLYEPSGRFTLRRYCASHGLPYRSIGLPVSRRVFCDYALAFQQRFVPDVEPLDVVAISRPGGAGAPFLLEREDGTVLHAAQVVLAIGISHYAHMPENLRQLPLDFRSHSSAVVDPGRYAGRRVAVVGGGSSAIDVAITLAAKGVETHVLTRRSTLRFHSAPRRRSLRERLRRPMSTVGPGWRGVLCTRLPDLFHAMPPSFRIDKTRSFLGPAPCWFTRTPFERDVRLHAGVADLAAERAGERLRLRFTRGGEAVALEVDHLVAATGYRPDVDRLGFLAPDLRAAIRREAGTPVLSRSFESTVPSLFFVGVSAANAFGPMLRFACGAGFAARRLTRRLARHGAMA